MNPQGTRSAKSACLSNIFGILNTNLNDWKNSFHFWTRKTEDNKLGGAEIVFRRHELALDPVDEVLTTACPKVTSTIAVLRETKSAALIHRLRS